MKDKDKVDIGIQYEDLTLLLSQLNMDAPKIQKLYSGLQDNVIAQNKRVLQVNSELNELSERTQKAIHEESDSAARLFKQYSAVAEQALNDAKKLKQQIDLFSSLVESTNKMMESIEQRLTRIEDKIETIELRPISAKDAAKQRLSKKTIKVDFEEVTTAKALYDKYYGKLEGPLIIQRTSWFGDYAFVVDELYRNGTWVKGVAYVDGEFRRNASYHADLEEFRMYNGPSAEKIKSIHGNENNMPF